MEFDSLKLEFNKASKMAMLRLGFSSSVVPLAVRAISSSRISCVFMSKAALPTVCERRHFSTDHDSGKSSITRKVVEAIQSEIKAHELALARNRGVPANLPFAIEDDPKYCHIMLKRDFNKEKIEVTVNPVHDNPVDLKGEDEDGSSSADSSDDGSSSSDSSDDGSSSSDSDDGSSSSDTDSSDDGSSPCADSSPSESVVINVSISKEKKGTLDVGAYVSADKIVVHRMSFTEPDRHDSSARYYVEAEGELQCALREFVKKRGIESRNVGFLYNYMIEKRKDWGTVWTPGRKPTSDDLKNLKKYFEDW